MSAYALGLDNGGSSVKAAIFDLSGNEIASASRSMDMICPKPGFTERNPKDTWNLNCDVIKEVLKDSKIKANEIIGVATTGYGNGIHMVDKNGNDVYKHIVSTDTRAQGYVDRFVKDGTFDKVREHTMQSIWAAQPPLLISWFRDNEPQVLEETHHIFSITDYVRFKLTGEAANEISNLSGTSQMNLVEQKTNRDIYKLFGIEEYYRLLPPMCESREMCGKITAQAAKETGLVEGIPVAGGFFDITACCLAGGVVDDSMLALTAGTWNISEYLSEHPVDDRLLFMNSISHIPNHYMVTEASPTCAGNFNWFTQNFMKEFASGMKTQEFYDYCDNAVAGIAPGESKVVFMPYVYGSNARTAAQGAFFNMNSFYRREHMLRAVYEGMAFSCAYHVQKLYYHKSDFELARLSGGMSNSGVWSQIISDVLMMPIQVVEGSELGAKGAAMSAAVVAGEFGNFEQAARAMVKISESIEPNERNKDVYAEKFENYKKAMELVSVFAESA